MCPVDEFEQHWERVELRMAMFGVLPSEDPVYVRVDPAVDVVYDDPRNGYRALQALRVARWPYSWYAEFQDAPPYTTVAIKKGRKTIARVYCRNTKLRNGRPRWGKLRFEREQRFSWRDQRSLDELAEVTVAGVFWGSVFGHGGASGTITTLAREVQTVKLVERVQLGEVTPREFEQLTGFLDVERLGLIDKIYTVETARRRRALARRLGIAATDAVTEPVDESLDEILDVPRRAWER